MLNNLAKKIRKLNKGLLAGLLLVGTGIILLAASLFNTWLSERSNAQGDAGQAFKNGAVIDDGTPKIEGNPVHISISSVGIDLHVIPGYYYKASNSWTLSLNDAQYGVMTAKPNNKEGDTFIYGHYRPGVFLTLPKIQPGAKAIVKTDNGHTFTYTFRQSVVTSPQDTSLFTYKGKPILVLQTCTGLWFQNRQLFTFDLTKVS